MVKRRLKNKKYNSTISLLIGIVTVLIGIFLIGLSHVIAWTLIGIGTIIVFWKMVKVRKVNKKIKNG